jgi:hypothetical protein
MKCSVNVPRVKFFSTLLFLALSLIIATISDSVEGGPKKITFEFTTEADLIKKLEAKLRELKKKHSNEFIVGSEHKSVPEGILEELRAFHGGGPSQSPCNGQRRAIAWCDAWSTQPEYYTDLIADVCVAAAVGNVSITLIRPDGKSIPLPVRSPEAKNVYHRATYRTTLDDPAGTYRFQVKGVTQNGADFWTHIELPKPAGPRLVWLADEQTLQLFGFKPKEQIGILAYVDQKLKGWRVYNVDPDGRLRIRALGGDMFVAVGEVSGEAQAYIPGLYMPRFKTIVEN